MGSVARALVVIECEAVLSTLRPGDGGRFDAAPDQTARHIAPLAATLGPGTGVKAHLVHGSQASKRAICVSLRGTARADPGEAGPLAGR